MNNIRKIVNMTTDKNNTYYAVIIFYPDGSNEYCFDVKRSDLIQWQKNDKTFGAPKVLYYIAYLERP